MFFLYIFVFFILGFDFYTSSMGVKNLQQKKFRICRLTFYVLHFYYFKHCHDFSINAIALLQYFCLEN